MLALIVAAVTSMLNFPQLSAQEPSSVFVDRVDVNVVNIEVFVFDKPGNRVVGLTKEDFEVLEDGQPVEITNFFAVDRGKRLAEGLEKGRLPEESTSSEEIRLLPVDRQLNLCFQRVALYRGVYPVEFEISDGHATNLHKLYEDIFATLKAEEHVAAGDLVIFTKGDLDGVTGSTNAMKILEVTGG